MKFLILGNDKTLLSLKPIDIPKDVTTIGINRSYLHIKSDYLSFVDIAILQEMIDHGINTLDFKMICSDRLVNFYNANELIKAHKIEIINRSNYAYTYSVDTAIDIFSQKFPNSSFYLYATSMKYDKTQNHFWSGYHSTLNTHGETWYKIRFPSMIRNIQFLSRKIPIYSCTKSSALNNFLPYKELNKI